MLSALFQANISMTRTIEQSKTFEVCLKYLPMNHQLPVDWKEKKNKYLKMKNMIKRGWKGYIKAKEENTN